MRRPTTQEEDQYVDHDDNHQRSMTLARQPIDILFHEGFQPQNTRAIAIHFIHTNRVLVIPGPVGLGDVMCTLPTQPGTSYIECGKLVLSPSVRLTLKLLLPHLLLLVSLSHLALDLGVFLKKIITTIITSNKTCRTAMIRLWW